MMTAGGEGWSTEPPAGKRLRPQDLEESGSVFSEALTPRLWTLHPGPSVYGGSLQQPQEASAPSHLGVVGGHAHTERCCSGPAPSPSLPPHTRPFLRKVALLQAPGPRPVSAQRTLRHHARPLSPTAGAGRAGTGHLEPLPLLHPLTPASSSPAPGSALPSTQVLKHSVSVWSLTSAPSTPRSTGGQSLVNSLYPQTALGGAARGRGHASVRLCPSSSRPSPHGSPPRPTVGVRCVPLCQRRGDRPRFCCLQGPGMALARLSATRLLPAAAGPRLPVLHLIWAAGGPGAWPRGWRV